MTTLSFKNVGIREDSRRNDVITKNQSLTPIGIKTPLALDSTEKEIFTMHYNVKDEIKDNIKNLLLTNHGERINQFDLGANLLPLMAEYNNKDDFDAEAMIRINTAISKFMPYVVPLEFDSTLDKQEDLSALRRIKILVVYASQSLNIERDQIELVLTVL
jgi:phage baseplate assembly protein W